MTFLQNTNPWVYLGILLAAAIEGDITLVAASVLVGVGKLNGWGVWFAAGLGGSLGDQFYFFVFKGRLRKWLSKIPSITRHQALIQLRLKQHAILIILASRFLAGMRIGIAVACSYAGVPARKFVGINMLSSFGWTTVVLVLVSNFGITSLSWLGIQAWWAPLIPALLVLLAVQYIARTTRALPDLPK